MTACEKTQRGERHGPHDIDCDSDDCPLWGTAPHTHPCGGHPAREELVAENERLKVFHKRALGGILVVNDRAERAEARVKELESLIVRAYKLFYHYWTFTPSKEVSEAKAQLLLDMSKAVPEMKESP